MKVLLINGSPHKEGCTYTALKAVADELNNRWIDTEICHIGSGDIHGCTGCGKCAQSGKCVFDDAVNEVSSKLDGVDGVIFGSPVYYASINGAMSAFLDRLFFSSGAKLAFKPGACVVSARRAGTTAALDQMSKYFGITNMPVVSSSYWNMVHGNKPEEVLQDQEGLQIMRGIGRNMAWMLKCIEAGKNAGIQLPQREEKIKTNFIR